MREINTSLADLAAWDNLSASLRWRGSGVTALRCKLPTLGAEALVFCSPKGKIFGCGPMKSSAYWDSWVFSFVDEKANEAPPILAECRRCGVLPESVKDVFPIDIDGTADCPYSVASVWFQKWFVRDSEADAVIGRFQDYVDALGSFALAAMPDTDVLRSGFWPFSGATREGAYPEAERLFARLLMGDLGVRDVGAFRKRVQGLVEELETLQHALSANGDPGIEKLGLRPFDVVWPQINIPLLDHSVSPFSKMRSATGGIAARMAQRAGIQAPTMNDDLGLTVRVSALRAEILSRVVWPNALEAIERDIGFGGLNALLEAIPEAGEIIVLLRTARQRIMERYPLAAVPLL